MPERLGNRFASRYLPHAGSMIGACRDAFGGHGWPYLDWLVRTRGSQICNALCPIAPPCEWRTRPQRQSLAAHQPRLAVAHANRKLPHLIPSNCKPVKQPKKDANMDINRTSGKPTAVQAHVRAALSARPEKKEHRQ